MDIRKILLCRDEATVPRCNRDRAGHVKQGPASEVLAKNALDDGFDASPALVGKEQYLRGFKYPYSIGTR
jgi:hypothetical protein